MKTSTHTLSPEEIKARLSIHKILDYYGAEKTTSKNLYFCPIHERGGKRAGHKPSLAVGEFTASCKSPQYDCFGGNADIFALIAVMENLDNRQDFPLIIKKSCDILGEYKTLPKIKPKENRQEIVQTEVYPLERKHLNYLRSTGIKKGTAELFQLKSRYDYILYPQIKNEILLGYKAIEIVEDAEGNRKMFFDANAKYMLWFTPHFKKQTHVIFTEGEKDCMRLTQEIKTSKKEKDFTVITFTTGAGTIPQNVADEIAYLQPKLISIFYDNDEAGKAGSKKLADRLLSIIDKVNIYSFSPQNKKGYDISDWFNEGKKFADLFRLEKDIITQPKVENFEKGEMQNDQVLFNDNLQNSSFFDDPAISFGLKDLKNDASPVEWLIQGFLTTRKIGALVATGSTGKSWFLLQLALAIASGNDFMRMYNPQEGGKVLYITGEEERDDIHRRIHAIKESYKNNMELSNMKLNLMGFKNEAVADKNLSFLCVNGRDALLNEKSPLLQELRVYVMLNKPRLIVLDPAIRFLDGDENSSHDATRFIEILESIRNLGTSVIFAHHTNKLSSGELNQHSARGSSAFIDGARWNFVLKKIHKRDAEKYRFEHDGSYLEEELCDYYINAEIVKCNGFKPIETEFTFRRSKNGVLVRDQKLVLVG